MYSLLIVLVYVAGAVLCILPGVSLCAYVFLHLTFGVPMTVAPPAWMVSVMAGGAGLLTLGAKFDR